MVRKLNFDNNDLQQTMGVFGESALDKFIQNKQQRTSRTNSLLSTPKSPKRGGFENYYNTSPR